MARIKEQNERTGPATERQGHQHLTCSCSGVQTEVQEQRKQCEVPEVTRETFFDSDDRADT